MTSLYNYTDFISFSQIKAETNRVILSYNSPSYKTYITIDKEGIPSSIHFDIKFEKDGIYPIQTEVSLKDKWLWFAFESLTKTDGNNYYQIKISPQYKNTPDILYASNGRTQLCSVKDGVCYYIVPVKEYEQQSTIVLGAVQNDLGERTLVNANIYVNVVDAHLIDVLEYNTDDIKNLLPIKEQCTIEGKDYVVIPNDKLIQNNNYYLLVMVASNVETIKMSSMYSVSF